MANVVDESAQTVSDQLTAIWNNFYDGSKSVEYFADVLTKLGADTASSTDEIAQGLEKFASVANDVGLSYEYATAALTTITDRTRQSADVVGTSLKTIFSRMQGLELGETLDDGTTLNDYSKALLAVGVNIKDGNGELKEMDTILDEVGAKWSTLAKDQRVALAQSVAGVRQYNQFISLMSNYDFFKENVQRAKDATGTLNEQNEIYKESWESASKYVKSSIQGIYDSIIDDKWLIKATNNVGKFISGIDQFIDSIGGLKTIIPAIGSIFLMMFANKIPEAISNIGYNIGVLSGKAYKQAAQIYGDTKEQIAQQLELARSSELYTEQEAQQLKTDLAIIKIKERMAINQKELTESEKKMVESTISELDNQNKLIQAIQEKRKLLADNTSTQAAERLGGRFFGTQETVERSFETTGLEAKSEAYAGEGKIRASHSINSFGINLQDLGVRMDSIVSDQIAGMLKLWKNGGYESADSFMQALLDSFNKKNGSVAVQLQTEMSEFFKQTFVSVSKDGGRADGSYGWVTEGLDVFVNQFSNLAEDPEIQKALKGLQPDANGVKASSEKIEAAIDLIDKKIQQANKAGEKFGLTFENITSNPNFVLVFKKFRENADALTESLKTASEKFDDFAEKAKKGTEHNIKLSETISSATGSVASLIFGFNNLRGALNSLNDADLTWGEKLGSIFTGLLTGFSMITKSFSQLSSTFAHIGGFENFKAETGTSFFSEEIASNFLGEITKSKLNNNNQKQISEWLSNAQNINLEAPKRIEAVESIKKAIDDGVKNGQIGKEAGLTLMNNLNAGMEQGVKSSISVIDKLKGAFSSLIAPPTGVILAVAAAIAAIGAALYAAYKHAQNYDPTHIYETQKEALEDYKAAADEASQNLKDFISGFDSYETAVEKTKDLTSGTTEMSDAIAEANQQAQDLIDKYDFLKGKWHYENGVITFDEGAEEEASSMLRQDANSKASQFAYQKTQTQKAKATNLFAKLDDEIERDRPKKALRGETSSYSVSETGEENPFEPIGAAIGEWLKTKFSKTTAIDNEEILKRINNSEGLKTSLINDNIDDFIRQTGDSWQEFGFYTKDEYKQYLEGNREVLIKYLNEYQDEIDGSTNKTADYQVYLMKAYNNEDISKAKFSGTEEEQNIKRDALAVVAAATQAENRTGSLQAEIGKAIENIKKGLSFSKADFNSVTSNSTYSSSETLQKLKAENGETLNAKDVAKYYEQIFGEGTSSGKDLKDLRETLIKKIITEALTNNEADISDTQLKTLQEVLDKVTPEQAQAINDAFKTAMEKGGLDKFEWGDYFKQINVSDLISQEGQADPNIIIQNLMGLTPEQFTALFGESAEKLKNSLSESVTQYVAQSNEDFAKKRGILKGSEKDWARYAKEVLNITEDLSEAQISEIRKVIEEAEKARDEAITTANSVIQMDDIFNEVGKAYEEAMSNPQTYSLSILDPSGSLGKLVTELEGGKEAFEEFSLAMYNANGNVDLMQNAFNRLATHIVNTVFETEGLTEATKTQAEARLKAMGITNAAEVVEGLYAQKLYEAEVAEIVASNGSDTLVNSLNGLAGKFEGVVGGADLAKGSLYLLAVEQIKTASTNLDFNSQINSLENLAVAAGMTKDEMSSVFDKTETLANIADIQKAYKQREISYGDMLRLIQEEKSKYKENVASAVEDQIRAQFAGLTSVVPTVSYSSPSSSSSNSSSNSSRKKVSKETTDKEYDKELTRYYKIEKEYEKANQLLQEMGEAKEEAYGQEHLRYLNQEISAQQKLINVTKKYLDEITAYSKTDLSSFNSQAAAMGLGIRVNSLDDLPSKYEAAEKAVKAYGETATAEYNKAMAAATNIYNSSSMDDAASERYETEEKRIEELYEQRMDNIEKLEQSLSLLDEDYSKRQEKIAEITAAERELRSKQIEVIQYKVELIGDASDAKEEFLNWYKELSPYQKYRVSFELNIDTEKFKQARAEIDDYSAQLEEAFNKAGINTSIEDFFNGQISNSDRAALQNNQELMNAISEISGSLIERAQSVKAAIDDMVNDFIDGLTREKDALQEYADAIDFVREGYTSLLNINELSGGWNKFNKAFDYSARVKEATKYLDAETALRTEALLRQGAEYQHYNEQRKLVEADYRAALESGDAARIEQVKKLLDTNTEMYQNAYNTWASGFEELLNNIYDNFSKKINMMFSEFDREFSTIQDKFEKANSLQEDYMSDFQKMYEVNKLNADIQKSINETKNVKSKQELVALQNKINQKAKEQTKMSEYEVQALRKQYELKLALQQLEDAQNAKSQVRLTRDENGNFGYLYTADDTEIADAQQNLNDKLYEYYNFNTERIQELSSTYLELISQMEEEILNLSLDQFESEEAYNQAVERIKEFYMQKMEVVRSEMNQALSYNNELTLEYSNSIASLGVDFQTLIDEFKDTSLADALGMEESQVAFDNFYERFFGTGGLIDRVKNEATNAFRVLGSTIDSVAESIGGEGGLSEAMSKMTSEFSSSSTDNLTAWSKILRNTLGENSALYKELIKTLPTMTSMFTKVTTSLSKLLGGSSNAQSVAAGSDSINYDDLNQPFKSNPRLVKWSALRAAIERIYGEDGTETGTVAWARKIHRIALGLDPMPEEPKRTLYDIDSDGKITVGDSRYALRTAVGLDDFDKDYPKYLDNAWNALVKYGVKFDTGGYTGAWGSSGRMAMLHEKELILNKQDTANLLSSVDILRGISKTLDLQAISAQFANERSFSPVGVSSKTAQPVQQEVHISASFPNVNNSKDIEAALQNLVNDAVQYTTQQF